MRLLFLLLLLFCAPAAESASLPLEGCIEKRLVADPQTRDPLDQLNRVRGVCYNIIGDERRIQRLAADARMYEHQLFQNKVLLFMVVLITVSGLLLSALQLWVSYKLAAAGRGALAEGGEVTLQQGSVIVKSSVIGVVILTISLGFFAIYVANVYEIKTATAFDEPGVSNSEGRPRTAPAGMKEIPR